MKKKRFVQATAVVLVSAMLPLTGILCGDTPVSGQAEKLRIPEEITLEKSDLGNPFLGFDAQGNRAYGGDPSILVDGDTVYAYVGHDVSEVEWYSITEYMCYSSKDLTNWKFENTIMNMDEDVSWADARDVAWASQVMKFKGKYYLLFCTTSAPSLGENIENCIGVAECDTPNGDFVCLDRPLILSSQTGLTGQWGSTGPANDIDPTAWVETDENGEERMYVTWGNDNIYTCEVEQNAEGHLEVVDQNKNGIVNVNDGDIVFQTIADYPKGWDYTEAPYLYRRKDENGKYYGPYYLFYAAGWREQMAYAVSDDIMNPSWEWGGKLMTPTATSNTNHMAVFDFKEQSYFVYHNGMLERGSGFRRSACIEKMFFDEDGQSILPIPETSTGLSGFTTHITDKKGEKLIHENFVNTTNDGDYPITKNILIGKGGEPEDALWELEKGKADPSNAAYVSIQSYNKPGLYLCADKNHAVMTQDVNGGVDLAQKMTFRTLKGFTGEGVTFESVYMPGYFLTNVNGNLRLMTDPASEDCTFYVESDIPAEERAMEVLKTKRTYTVGDELNVNDIRITLSTQSGEEQRIAEFKTNADQINMSKPGKKTLTVSCEFGGKTFTQDVKIRVVEKSVTW